MHASHVARVLHLHAAVHDYVQSAIFGDLRTLGADHAKLQPQRVGANLHRFARDVGHELRRAKDVHDVNMERDVLQRCVRFFADGFSLTRVNRHDAVAVPLQVEANEVARAQNV